MKSIFPFFIIFLCIEVAFGQTNVYQPFPNDSAIWSVSYTGSNGNLEKWLGDTIINAISYKKAYYKHDSSAWSYGRGIRQDIPSEKIYQIDLNNIETDISVNQHLVIGDSMPNVPPYHGLYFIKSIDSLLVGTKYHKRYNAERAGGGFMTWSYVVGVGTIYVQEWNLYYYGLQCFSVNNIKLLGNASYCQFLSIDEPLRNENNTSIIPNPFFVQTALHTDWNLKNASLTIYNSFGQEVKQMGNLTGQTVIFNRNNLPSGLYFLCLIEDGKVIATDKLVIIDN